MSISTRRNSANPPRPYRFSINLPDHVADTIHLSAEEHGCLMRLLFSYWRSGAPSDDNRILARIVGMSPSEWLKVRPAVEPFFDIRHGQWISHQTDCDLDAAHAAINANRERTKAATAARKVRASIRDDQRDDQRDVNRDDQRSEVLTVNRSAPREKPIDPDFAPARERQFSGDDFETAVRAAEHVVAGGAE